MISALIFSMNRVENVIKLAEKLKNYVDEIVIIDSSDREKFELMKEKIPYAKIYWFPPLGMADFYYKIGLELCTNDWILHLDDDEEPNDMLLKNLRSIINSGQVFSILRLNTYTRQKQKIFRLFNKSYIIPSGLIHVPWMSKVKPIELDEKYHIIHYEKDIDFKKVKKYAVYESWQFGCKIFDSIFATYVKYKSPPTFVRKIGKILFFQTKIGRLGWFLLAVEYYLYFLFTWIIFIIKNKSLRSRYLPLILLYWLFIQLNLFKNFSKKLEVSMRMNKHGVFEFLGLDSYENALKSLEDLNSKNGLENFVKLVEKRLQIFKS